MIRQMRSATKPLRIAIVGKYTELHDAYMSVKEALFHAASAAGRQTEILWLHSGELEKGKGFDELAQVDGIIVPGGFGYRGVEGKVIAARYAREKKVPYLGLCLGMQVMSIEFARNVLNIEDANSSEFGPSGSENNVIDLMADQRGITDLGGTMRLGLYPCVLKPTSKAAEAYETKEVVKERHRHRFEFNNAFRQRFEEHGAVFSGVSPDNRLVEIMEVENHPFMVGSQFHPEFMSRPNNPHPLFNAFVKAAVAYHEHDEHNNGHTTTLPQVEEESGA